MAEAAALGVDIGGTKLLALAVGSDGEVLERRRLTTPRGDGDALGGAIGELARELGPGLPLGIGVAGITDRDGTLRYGPNLAVEDVPLGRDLRGELEVPVAVHNDVTVALYAEWRIGAARGADDVVMVTLGTGVGGAVITGGRLLTGADGLAGELGHLPVSDGGRPCGCGNRGCLEAYASGSAVGLRARERLTEEDGPSELRELDRDAVDGKAVTLAALDGDAFALEVLGEAGYWLGVGLTGIVNVFDPAIVVIGGGAATLSAPIVVPQASRVVAERVIGADHRTLPPVVPAELADDAGAIGAALLALDEVRSG